MDLITRLNRPTPQLMRRRKFLAHTPREKVPNSHTGEDSCKVVNYVVLCVADEVLGERPADWFA